MLNFNFSIGRSRDLLFDKTANGWFYEINNAFKSVFAKTFSDKEKYEVIRTNLGVLFVFDFIAKNYSQQKVNEWRNDRLFEKNVLYSISPRPNQWQTWTDFLYDYCFWLLVGNVYVYKQGDVVYCLNPFGIKLQDDQLKKFSKLGFSKYGENTVSNIKKGSFKYTDEQGNKYNLDLANLHVVNDLSGGVNGSYFNAGSKLDALYQVVKNLDLSLKAKYINTEFTGKFIVAGQSDPSNVTELPMTENEKKSIRKSVKGNEQVIPVKSKVAIERFVSDLAGLKLDDHIIADIHYIGMMYGLSKDVIGIAIKGSTYENKEKAFGAFVDYTLTPISRQMTDLFELLFDKEDLRGSWADMPFNQVFEAEKVQNDKLKLENLKIAKELGMSDNEVQQKLLKIYGQ